MKYGEQPVGFTLSELQHIARKGFCMGIVAGFFYGVVLCVLIVFAYTRWPS